MSFSGISSAVFIIFAMAMAMTHSVALAQDNPKDYVNAHNKARARLGLPAVRWDANIAIYASRLATLCQYIHASGPYGENLFSGSGRIYHAADAVNGWVSEGKYYNCQHNSCSAPRGTCGHYTQVVWKSTARIGCARALCLRNRGGSTVYYIVCNYDPAGNVSGRRPYPCT